MSFPINPETSFSIVHELWIYRMYRTHSMKWCTRMDDPTCILRCQINMTIFDHKWWLPRSSCVSGITFLGLLSLEHPVIPLHVAFVAIVIDNVRCPSSGYTCPLADLLRILPRWISCCFHGYWWRCMASDSVDIALLLYPCFLVEHVVFYSAQCENESYTAVSPTKVSHFVHYSQGRLKFGFQPIWI